IGVGLTSFGALFMLLGVMLFFDGALLALGNVLFLGGLSLIIGSQKTFYFFARKNKLRGTACFFGGILLVFLKWQAIGVFVEMFVFLNLSGFSASRFTCHRCMAIAQLYIITSLPTHACLSLIALDSVIGSPPTDHRLWPAAAPRF
ncbi:hypothetical protein BGW80DRAFT_1323778, partial [Lactifluus volemus]